MGWYGETLYAKYFEAEMSSKGEELQNISKWVNASRMCYEPIMKYGKAAMDSNDRKQKFL